MRLILLSSVFVVATCGLVYELIAGTLASYLLGDSVTQFSTIIGTYLFAMGIGSHLSRYVQRNLIGLFIRVEILIGIFGGSSAALLFLAFDRVAHFRILLYGIVTIVGVLVGLEIPLLIRILKDRFSLSELIADVFTFDYVGALVASILFPLVFVPQLGLVRTSFFFGILNVAVALWALIEFRDTLPWAKALRASAVVALVTLIAGFACADWIVSAAEAETYSGAVIHAETSPYQRVVLTRSAGDLRLYLNGNLQFSSRDEYRYHEALVHPGAAAVSHLRRALVLGGGDGLAVRELLKYPELEAVTLVDLDPTVTRLFAEHPLLRALNGESLRSPKVEVVNQDAFIWLRTNAERYDLIVIDFPDPSSFSLGKLYSTTSFRMITQALAPKGLVAVQSTSPFVARRSFWCVNETLRAVGLETLPYHAYVPSFGEWGFILAGREPIALGGHYPEGLRFVDAPAMAQMMAFPSDMGPLATVPNRLNNQALVHYFEDEWAAYSE